MCELIFLRERIIILTTEKISINFTNTILEIIIIFSCVSFALCRLKTFKIFFFFLNLFFSLFYLYIFVIFSSLILIFSLHPKKYFYTHFFSKYENLIFFSPLCCGVRRNCVRIFQYFWVLQTIPNELIFMLTFHYCI